MMAGGGVATGVLRSFPTVEPTADEVARAGVSTGQRAACDGAFTDAGRTFDRLWYAGPDFAGPVDASDCKETDADE